MPGTVHREKYLCLHTGIGEVSSEDTKLKLLVALPLHTPMIVHPDGRTWTLGWQELSEMAFAAFDQDSLAQIVEKNPCPA